MSINIVKGGKLVRVASNVDGISSTEKGAAGGIATLDGNGKVPKDQLPEITALDTNAAPGYRTEGYISEPGWHRIATFEGNSIGFVLDINRSYTYNPSEGYKVLVQLTAFKQDKCHFTQLAGGVVSQTTPKIRILYRTEGNKTVFYLDVYYSASKANLYGFTLNEYSTAASAWMPVIMNKSLNDIIEESEEGTEIYEFPLSTRPGLIADYAVADRSGNDIENTYFKKDDHNVSKVHIIDSPEKYPAKLGSYDILIYKNLGTEENPYLVPTHEPSILDIFEGGYYKPREDYGSVFCFRGSAVRATISPNTRELSLDFDRVYECNLSFTGTALLRHVYNTTAIGGTLLQLVPNRRGIGELNFTGTCACSAPSSANLRGNGYVLTPEGFVQVSPATKSYNDFVRDEEIEKEIEEILK